VTLAPGVHRIRVPVPFPLEHVNVYLVDTGRGFLMLDTGVGTWRARTALDEGLDRLGLDYGDITGVVLTHFHPDHTGGAALVRQRSGAPVVMSRVDAGLLAGMLRNGGAPAEDDLAGHGVPRGAAASFREIMVAATGLVEPFTPDDTLTGAGRLPGGRPLYAVPTPGHTPGHLCVHLPDADLLFTGDHVLPGITPHVGRYSAADPNPLAGFLGSLQAILALGPRRLLPAHGEPVEAPAERVRQLEEHHARRLAATLAATGSRGATAWDAAHGVFGTDLDAMGALLAFFETLAHLEYLRFEGLVHREPSRVLHVYRQADGATLPAPPGEPPGR
jgi:glyoxylase-like metal-dependent hydrolase (beta-lactamase superfamily II)